MPDDDEVDLAVLRKVDADNDVTNPKPIGDAIGVDSREIALAIQRLVATRMIEGPTAGSRFVDGLVATGRMTVTEEGHQRLAETDDGA